jgi:hypothetical protein
MRRVLLAVACVVGVAAPATLAPAALAQSGENVPLESRWIGAVVPLRAGHYGLPKLLYRSLIPAPYSMPARPLVGIYLVDLYAPHSTGPGQGWDDYAHWLEGGVDLQVAYRGELGWYHLAMPVNSNFEYGLGRGVGFPKYHAGAVFDPSGAGWTATAYPATTGYMSESVTWMPSAGARVPPELLLYAAQKQPFFSLNPALVGPAAERTTFTPSAYMPDSLPAPTPGSVHLRLDPTIDAWDNTLPDLFTARGSTLRDLIALDQTLPGVMWHSQAIYNLDTEDIGQGGYSKAAAAEYLQARRRALRRAPCRRGRAQRCSRRPRA